MNNLEYCWYILPKISRSFALCIPVLPEVTKDFVCVAYNLCRIVDAVEDSKEKNIERKKEQLDIFKNILLEERVKNLKKFIEPVSQKAPNKYEADLIRNTHKIIITFSNFPDNIKYSIKRWTLEMIDGMKEYLGTNIETLREQDRYCFFVAGTVGNMLTEIYFACGHITEEEYPRMLELAPDFGLGLQKTNIIKNIKIDFKEGREYWPLILLDNLSINYENLFEKKNSKISTEILNELIIDAQRYLNKGLEYILIINSNQPELRNSCCIPLFMAVATLSVCYNNPKLFFSEKSVKISKNQASEILKISSEYCQDDSKIIDYFNKLRTF